jgi:hypothetical protein
MMPIGRSAFPGVEKLGWFDGAGGSVFEVAWNGFDNGEREEF